MAENDATLTPGSSAPADPWATLELPLREEKRIDWGPLQLHLKMQEEDLLIAERRESKPDCQSSDGGDLSWTRWAEHRGWREIRFSPCLPALPVVVKAETPLVVSPGAEIRVHVRCPLWVRLEINDTEGPILDEIPTVLLSKTWFGVPTEGTFCYWLSSGIRRNIEPDPSRPYLAICPIWIENRSGQELMLERICLRVGILSLFSGASGLQSNEFRVIYFGGNSSSDITAGPKPGGKMKLVTKPRQPLRQTLAARTFRTLRDVAGF